MLAMVSVCVNDCVLPFFFLFVFSLRWEMSGAATTHCHRREFV